MNIIRSVFKPESIILFISLVIFSCNLTNFSENEKPLIVITFDDQHSSIFENALPLMNKYGFTATNVVNTEYIGKEGRLNWTQVETLEFDHNWETAGHTLHHVNLPDCSMETAEYEVRQDWQNLKDRGLSHETFALPSGHATEEQLVMISKYYRNIRTSLDLHMKNPIDRLHLGYFFYATEYNADEAIYRLICGIENNEDVIIIGFHRVYDEIDDHPDICQIDDFEKILKFIKDNDLKVVTIKKAMKISIQ